MNKKVIKAKAISHGSTIGVISPASRPTDDEKYKNGMRYLKEGGYQVVESKHVLDNYGYLAGTDTERADDFNLMFKDSQIDAVICSRGGYGSPRIVEAIDLDLIQKNPKVFVGYSDITVLNLAIFAKTGLVTFSGPMLAVEMGKGIDPFTEKSFWDRVTAENSSARLDNPSEMPIQIYKQGQAEGRLLGGCLSLINVVLGTPYCPDFSGAILFIEDIEEEPYRIDRYLAQLRMAGILNKISGLVIGQFVDCKPHDPEKPGLELSAIFDDYFSRLDIPIVSNFAYGHIPVKHTIPTGVMAKIDTEAGEVLTLTESAVIENVK